MDVLELGNLALFANDRGSNGDLLPFGAAIPSRVDKVLLVTRLGLTLRGQDENILIGSRNSNGKVSEWASLISCLVSERMASRAHRQGTCPKTK